MPFEVSTVTAEPNVTAASTVSPSLQTPSAPGSETTSAAVTAGAGGHRVSQMRRHLPRYSVSDASLRWRPLVSTTNTLWNGSAASGWSGFSVKMKSA